MRHQYLSPLDEKDKTIQNLKLELYLARHNLLNLMPYDTQRLLNSYGDCETRKDTHRWLERTVDEIIEKVELLPENKYYCEQRANCPLCGGGSSSGYTEGFSVPEGLRRHLVGFGNVRQCSITQTAYRLAWDDWKEKFAEQEEQERIQKQETLKARRQVETLYKISPFAEPLLIDESIWIDGARDPEQLQWAAERLTSLGLKNSKTGLVESWTDERDTCIVYADIRQLKRITFSVWKKPLPKRSSNPYKICLGSFDLLDGWKKDLTEKYEMKLLSVLK